MNLVRQRDEISRMCELGILSKKQAETALISPVFQWWTGDSRQFNDEEWEFVKQHLFDEINVMTPDGKEGSHIFPKMVPYECFRIAHMDVPVFEQWFVGKHKAFCARCDDGYSHKDVVMHSIHLSERTSSSYKIWMWMNGKKADASTIDGKEVWSTGRMRTEMSRDELGHFYYMPMQGLSYFLFDIYSSYSSVIKVSDDTPGKSVQWRKAREHYLVLQKRQAMELQSKGRGVQNVDLVRSAHWRRAHLRRLSSGKFKNKRGLIVPVKKAWVGPQEWKGNDGKTYTVVGFQPPDLK